MLKGLLNEREEIEFKLFEGVEFTGEMLADIEDDLALRMCKFVNCTFKNIPNFKYFYRFFDCAFSECTFEDMYSYFNSCKFVKTNFANLNGALFDNCTLKLQNFENSKGSATFRGCDLRGARLEGFEHSCTKSLENFDCVL